MRAVLLCVAVWLVAASASAQRAHVVAAGDTLSAIARRMHTTVDALRRANHLRGDTLRLGQTLHAPGAAPAERAPARPSRAQRQAEARARRLDLGIRAGQAVLTRGPERRWIQAAGRGRSARTLRLPVDRARFIRGWGSGPGGYHLAVDLRGAVGAPIRAADRGLVVYSGDGISGYGNFVMIVHPGGRVTAYAHNRENLVVEGQLVRRGEVVAHLGNTGLSHGPHLHFMWIDDGAHCDPMPFFEPRPAMRRGAGATRRRAPASPQCLPRSARPHPGHAADPDADLPADAEPEDTP